MLFCLDRRDYDRDRDNDRRDRDRRDGRRRDDGRDRDHDSRKDPVRYEDDKEGSRRADMPRDPDRRQQSPPRSGMTFACVHSYIHICCPLDSIAPPPSTSAVKRLNLDPDAPDGEEGEQMLAPDEEEAKMMAMMGLSGFDTTKVCHRPTELPTAVVLTDFIRVSM